MNLEFSAKTDKGLKRDHNEDAYGVFPENNIFFTCDGMGGHAAGDYASKMAVETIASISDKDSHSLFDKLEESYQNIPEAGLRLVTQIMLANRRLFRLAVMYPKLRGMGTTVTAAAFDKGYVNIVNVGDSRTYLFRNSKLSRLTVDHSWVEEMLQDGEIKEQELDRFGAKNVITRALGTNGSVKIDYKAVRTRKEDIFLLCSDGLCGEISDALIEKVFKSSEGDLDLIASRLIEEAKKAGGSDNITVVLVKVREEHTLSDVIKPGKMISVDEDSSVLEMLDAHIDRHFPPAKTPVPPGVEREKEKLYHNPLIITLSVLFLLLAGAAFFANMHRRQIAESIDTAQLSRGDILIRTEPSGARVSIVSNEGDYEDEKSSPADFMSLEEGHYRAVIEKEGYESETVNIYLREGLQESRHISLAPMRQIFLTIGVRPGFDSAEVVYIDDEPFIYYGRPLTVGRIGFAGKRINVGGKDIHTVRIGEEVKDIEVSEHGHTIEVLVEDGELLLVE